MSKNVTSGKPKRGKDQFGMTAKNWERLDALTDDEINARAAKDPDCPPSTPGQLSKMRRVSPARFIRQKLGMSIERFAAAYDIPVGKLSAWERHLEEPNSVELAYLRAIERAPEAVKKPIEEASSA